jgi:hypothetical protein
LKLQFEKLAKKIHPNSIYSNADSFPVLIPSISDIFQRKSGENRREYTVPTSSGELPFIDQEIFSQIVAQVYSQ